jgi:hypothetical protein
MENPNFFQSPAVSAQLTHADGVPRPYGLPSYLRGRRGLLLATGALAIIAFFAGWRWFGTVAILPLLYILPCAAMMAMCMRGQGASGNTPTTPNNSAGSGPAASQ